MLQSVFMCMSEDDPQQPVTAARRRFDQYICAKHGDSRHMCTFECTYVATQPAVTAAPDEGSTPPANDTLIAAVRAELASDGLVEAPRTATYLLRSLIARIDADAKVIADYEQTTGDVCPVCGWRGRRGQPCEFCEVRDLREVCGPKMPCGCYAVAIDVNDARPWYFCIHGDALRIPDAYYEWRRRRQG